MTTKLKMTLLTSLAPLVLSSPALATTSLSKMYPTPGVYQLSKTVKGVCLQKIKIYYSPEVDQLDILGTQPGESVLQMTRPNAGEQRFIFRDEKKELTSLHTTTSTLKEGHLEYSYTARDKYGYVNFDVKLKANFNLKMFTMAALENGADSRSHGDSRSYACVYTKM